MGTTETTPLGPSPDPPPRVRTHHHCHAPLLADAPTASEGAPEGGRGGEAKGRRESAGGADREGGGREAAAREGGVDYGLLRKRVVPAAARGRREGATVCED
jgi:hypothetical protein